MLKKDLKESKVILPIPTSFLFRGSIIRISKLSVLSLEQSYVKYSPRKHLSDDKTVGLDDQMKKKKPLQEQGCESQARIPR